MRRPLMDRSRRRAVLLYAFYAALSLTFCAPLFAKPTGLGVMDWDQHLFYYAQVIKNVVEYRQPPFWSPWYCGGNVLWQNPQIPVLSPVYLLTPLFGLALAMKINIVLHYWIGFVGMHLLLTRVIGLTFMPFVVYLASIFVLGGAMAMHLAVGHSVFLPAMYLPLLIYFFVRAVQTGALRPAMYSGGILALTIYNGGLHVVPMAVLGVGVLAIGLAAASRSWIPIALAIVVGASGALYAAPKLVPVAQFVTSDRFWDSRDEANHRDILTPALIARAYADPSQNIGSAFSAADQRHGWLEYGNYIGALAAVLIAASLVWFLAYPVGAAARLGAPIAATAGVFLLLTVGDFGRFAPAALLQHLPLFSSFRLPSRYTVAFVPFGVMAAALMIRQVSDRMVWTRTRYAAAATICAIGVIQLVVVNQAHFAKSFSLPPLETGFRVFNGTGTLDRDHFVNPYLPNAPMLHALMNDQAVMWCDETLQLKRGADDQRPFVWTMGSGQVSSVQFTPNRVRFSAVGGPDRTKVFLNQNYSTGWRSDAGPVRLDPQAGGRMYVELAPGQTGRFSFSFVPPGIWSGVGLLAIGLAASWVAWNRRLRAVGAA